ncbi:hypothetical protein SNE40_007888 [Patella caerulea]|uniref:Uncharacterized protein n=1 Tax=Patella caerulea TaxID=87958 RepID=A0AAN8Q936_PATCE
MFSFYFKFKLRKPERPRRSLSLNTKRCMEESEMKSSPTLSRKSNCLVPNRIPKETRLVNVVKEEEIQDRDVFRIKLAVERLSDSEELIADCSRPYTLHTICGKHKDLKSITPLKQ